MNKGQLKLLQALKQREETEGKEDKREVKLAAEQVSLNICHELSRGDRKWEDDGKKWQTEMLI